MEFLIILSFKIYISKSIFFYNTNNGTGLDSKYLFLNHLFKLLINCFLLPLILSFKINDKNSMRFDIYYYRDVLKH